MAEATSQQSEGAKKANLGRKTLRALGRKKRVQKLASDPEYRKAFHAAKSKRALDKKAAYRKKKRGKK